jgi:hypothetical protein
MTNEIYQRKKKLNKNELPYIVSGIMFDRRTIVNNTTSNHHHFQQ